METYSPSRMSRLIPESACVSTSSVRNTLVTPVSRINGAKPFPSNSLVDSSAITSVDFMLFMLLLIVSNQKSDSEIRASSVEFDRAHPTRWYRKGSPDPPVGDRPKSESCSQSFCPASLECAQLPKCRLQF